MEGQRKRVRYNNFLCTDSDIPRTTAWRRKIELSPQDSISIVPINHELDVEEEFEHVIDERNEMSGDDSDATQFCTDEDNGVKIHLENADSPLFPNSRLSHAEAFASILAFSVRFHLSKICLQEFLKLLEILLPPTNLPGSEYSFLRKVSSLYDNACEVHFYCKNCDSLICKLEDFVKPDVCPCCQELFSSEECMANGNFFLYMPLEPQLKAKLENQNLMTKIQDNRLRLNPSSECYRDVVDGEEYKAITALQNKNNISVQFNVDGIPIYKKSKSHLWPIQCMVNELPPSARKDNIMMCGLWFGASKPKMNSYMKPFTDELTNLSSSGFEWCDKALGQVTTTKVFPILCSSDAPARAALQNFVQYNGKHGCGFCENEGEFIERGRGHCRIYSVTDSEERTLSSTILYAEQAIVQGKPYRGVKGASILLELQPSFHIVKSFVPDYMHAVLLGVVRQCTTLWVESSGMLYSLNKASIAELNKRILDVKLPHEVTRQLRSTSDLAFWKASEWRLFLSLSPVLLDKILHKYAFKHWLLLAHGITLLLQSPITKPNIEEAEASIAKFIRQFPDVYGREEQSYNVHILSHLPAAAKSWGPLWAHSCFIYEDFIGQLKSFHHGTKGVPTQILSSYLNKSVLQMLSKSRHIKNEIVHDFIGDMVRGKSLTKKCVFVDGVRLFGNGKESQLLRMEELALKKCDPSVALDKVMLYKRFILTSNVYSTASYCKQFKRVDCILGTLYNNREIVVNVTKIFTLHSKVFIVGEKLNVSVFKKTDVDIGKICTYIFKQNEEADGEIIVFAPQAIVRKYSVLQVSDNNYFVSLFHMAEQ